MALQALALYSTLVFSPDGCSTVTVDSPGHQLTFDVNQNNKLLYQEKELKDVEGKYRLEAKGNACASVQVCSHCSTSCFSKKHSNTATAVTKLCATPSAIQTSKSHSYYKSRAEIFLVNCQHPSNTSTGITSYDFF